MVRVELQDFLFLFFSELACILEIILEWEYPCELQICTAAAQKHQNETDQILFAAPAAECYKQE